MITIIIIKPIIILLININKCNNNINQNHNQNHNIVHIIKILINNKIIIKQMI